MATVRVVSKRKIKRFIFFCIIFLILTIALCFYLSIRKVNNNNEIVPFEVKQNDTYMSISKRLKESKLIRSELSYKIYTKIKKPNDLKIGVYPLKQNMDVEEILDTLKKGPDKNLTSVKLTFPEGINFRKFATIIEKNTSYKKEDVYSLLENTSFIDKLINKYWFLTNEIKNKEIYYSLEGYMYPDTYIIGRKDSLEDIIYIILNNTSKKLEKYKTTISSSSKTMHQVLTLASVVELEASSLEDRKKVAGVFYNRLGKGMGLESDVTTYYGLKKEMTDSISGHVYDYNAYNTRNTKLNGKLPVGPVCNPSIEAIDAVINYTKVTYLYFVASTDGKVYFANTYLEHQKIINKLKGQKKWKA